VFEVTPPRGEVLRRKCRIMVALVMPWTEPGKGLRSSAPLGYAAAVDARDDMADQLADEVARRADSLVEATFVRAMGDAPSVLAEVPRAQRADLMVVGRSGKAPRADTRQSSNCRGAISAPTAHTGPARTGPTVCWRKEARLKVVL
jgi:hypothetical protein